jgi:PTH1 family peptidyl-tRNA hydrolase
MKIIVGLGNPGPEYARNRHNIGFMAVDRIARLHVFSPWKKKFQGEIAEGRLGSDQVLLLKPLTYMNESGRSVGEALRFYKCATDDVTVLHDEIDLAPGKVRLKTGGGNAGHNGLKSITAHIGNDYHRLRIGVGHPGAKELVHRHVLSDFARSEADWVETLLDAVAEATPWLVSGDGARAVSDIAMKTGEGGGQAAAPAAPSARKPSQPAPASEGALAGMLKKWLGQ